VHVNGEIVVTPELYRTVLKAILGKAVRRPRLLGAVVVVLGVVALVLGDGDPPLVPTALIAAGLAIVFLLPWRVLSLSTKRAAPALAGPWRYEIDAERIRLTTPLASSEWTWLSLQTFEDHPDFWLLRTRIKNVAVVVVKAAFSPVDQRTIADLGARRFASATKAS
jgi:hypothetical protein